jgi:DNA-binding MarR family transcriptional regulator
MSKKFYNPHQCLGFMTFTASRLLSSGLHREMVKAGIDLTSEQWGILMQLWNYGAVSQEELAPTCGLDKSSISRALRVLERRKLIVRTANPVDTRRKNLQLTDEADALKDRALAAVKATIAKAFTGVDRERQKICIEVLASVQKNLKK